LLIEKAASRRLFCSTSGKESKLMTQLRLTPALLSLLLLSGCSGTYHAYYETLSYAFKGPTPAEVSLQQLQQAPADLMYVVHGPRARATMALAFIEHNQTKWVSSDDVTLTLEQGRIVRTTGLQNNLLSLNNRDGDPLKLPYDQLNNRAWQRQADWSAGEFGYSIQSRFTRQGADTLNYFEQQIPVVHITEQLHYNNRSNYLRYNQSWQNHYWFHAQSGRLLKTRQQLSPLTESFELVFISQVARVLQEQSSVQTP
jgi:hypothetical protein